MDEHLFYSYLTSVWFALAGVTFVSLFFVTAPYGRFTRRGWGPRLSARWGWLVMELPASVLFFVFFALGQHHTQPWAIFFLVIWQIHYLHRSLIYPFRIRGDRRQTTWLTVLLAIIFNSGNVYLNARYLYTLGPGYDSSWFFDPRFICGVLFFVLGFAINKQADRILIGLRKPGQEGYKIPHGGLYRFVSNPNYLGEMLQWAGWALACWNIGALAFFVWTVANLAPRALANHKWYLEKFPDYPKERKALIPFVV